MVRRELFIIGRDVMAAVDLNAIDSTAEALKECGLYNLPFPSIDLMIDGDAITRVDQSSVHVRGGGDFQKLVDQGTVVHVYNGVYATNYGEGFYNLFENLSLDHCEYVKSMYFDENFRIKSLRLSKDVIDPRKYGKEFSPNDYERNKAAKLIISLLATRNSVKARSRNKLAAMGVGKNSKNQVKRHEYVTRIQLPQITDMEDDADNPATDGKARAPHLRRGHTRNQRHGHGLVLVKKVFIEPVFVNADRDWVSKREAYIL
jgi:hypothetical protein